jgi:hypothetical protein
MTKPEQHPLPDLGRIGQALQQNAGRVTRLAAQLHSHLDELTCAVAKEDWVYAHRVASALARISSTTGDAETQAAAEAVCATIERSGETARIHRAVRRLCRPTATALDLERSS